MKQCATCCPAVRRWMLLFLTSCPAAGLAADAGFDLDPAGYVKHWLVTGPDITPHYGGRTDSGRMPNQEVAGWSVEMPDVIALGQPGPFGEPWRCHASGDNVFMEFDANVPEPSAGRMFAAVDLTAPQDMALEARVWLGGWAHLWLNGRDLGSHQGKLVKLRLSLVKGRNRFVALLRHGGLRAVHLRIGLQLPGQTGRVHVHLPGPDDAVADCQRAEAWIRSLRLTGGHLNAAAPPPFPIQISIDREVALWPAGQSAFALPAPAPHRFRVEMEAPGQRLERSFEFPLNRPLTQPDPEPSRDDHHAECLTKMLGRSSRDGINYIVDGIIHRLRGETPVDDAARLAEALRRINRRIDCADFDLAFALRFCRLGAGTEQEREQIRLAALGFRHWQDEPGQDGMCFHSENHRLLYHGNQMIAGNLWPDAIFSNSGRTGRQQAALGRERCLRWLDAIEAEGYEEFLSTTYVPITVGALMNLVDFADDAGISRRATRQMDKIYRMLAEHTFDGVMTGPQGRAYRWMLDFERLGTQALLSYATPQAIEAVSSWTIFVASSPHYRPPADLEERMTTPIRKQYREAHFLINLNKAADYMLSSVEIPASARDPSFTRQLEPGKRGYQQHIWQAVLGRDCHVFTNHPGASHDMGDSRPSFWAGNGVFPRQTQEGNLLLQIFALPDDEPIRFTHAYWPTDVFDAQESRGNWSFGRRKKGYIALWCSTKPELRSEVLTDRELRAWGDHMAWVCVCSSERESGSFSSFVRSCEQLEPEFDATLLRLRLRNHPPLTWEAPQAKPQAARP